MCMLCAPSTAHTITIPALRTTCKVSSAMIDTILYNTLLRFCSRYTIWYTLLNCAAVPVRKIPTRFGINIGRPSALIVSAGPHGHGFIVGRPMAAFVPAEWYLSHPFSAGLTSQKCTHSSDKTAAQRPLMSRRAGFIIGLRPLRGHGRRPQRYAKCFPRPGQSFTDTSQA
jgi:hypothetical protein